MLELAALVLSPLLQAPTAAAPTPDLTIRVALTPCEPDDGHALSFSPKAGSVTLHAVDESLSGALAIGGDGQRPFPVALRRSARSPHFDQLAIDLDRDGAFDAAEILTTTPTDRRGRIWSSFATTLQLDVPADGAGAPATTRAYPLAMWYVADPAEPDAPPRLRFTRRGWHAGQAVVDGAVAIVLIADGDLDGVFTERDTWRIGRDFATVRGMPVRELARHDWLDGRAWRPVQVDPHGRFVEIAPFDPGQTEAEERAAEDRFAADRAAPRATQPLAFRRDVDAALAAAAAGGRRVLLDFETTWCGPCKQMDALVYPAQAVVDAAVGVVCIKVDGDERRDLVQRHAVSGYPTLVLLEADGAELRRASGYQSVVEVVRLLRGDGSGSGTLPGSRGP